MPRRPPKESRPFLAPDDQAPEAWLLRHDRNPAITPDWPASTHVGVVVVYDNREAEMPEPEEPTTAYVLLSETALRDASAFTEDPRRRLFFRVLWADLEKACPGCTASKG